MKINILKYILSLAFVVFSVLVSYSQSSSKVEYEKALQKMHKNMQLISDYMSKPLTIHEYMGYVSTSEENVARWKDIKKTMKKNTNYDEAYLDNLISGEIKLQPAEAVGKKEQ